ncbi:MAG: hypothetical protein ABI400_12590 [Lacisediminihabitans sp.]
MSKAKTRNSILFGVVMTVVLLALGIFIPWQGSTFPQNLSWLWFSVAIGAAVSFSPGRLFGLWLFLGLLLDAVVLGLFGHRGYLTIFCVYLAGAVFGATIQSIYRRRRGVAPLNGGIVAQEKAGTMPDALIVAVYPRDDVRWADDGVERSGQIEVRSAGADQATNESRAMGDFSAFSPVISIGGKFELQVTATFGHEHFDQKFHFYVTGDEDDVQDCTVGAEMQVKSRRGVRKTADGFEFGATVMGAKLEKPQ